MDESLDVDDVSQLEQSCEIEDAADLHFVDIPVLRNYGFIDRRGKNQRQGLAVAQVRNHFLDLTSGWPKRAGDALFVAGPDLTPQYLQTPTELFAWAAETMVVDWARLSDAISQEQFFQSLVMTVERYDAVETVPHWPPLPGIYYLHPPLPDSDGSYLETFADFFSPLTSVDGHLNKALIRTLFWGGEPGSRPAFLITGPDHDPGQGRGVGKSKFSELLSELVGGFMDFSPSDDIVAIKKRLLSPDARPYRVARLDNIKTLRFSWADLEGLITSPVISGHRMYKGEGRRPNTLVWILTLNGASLSKDMAQRCINVKLQRPQHAPGWERQVREFIREHRWQIIADVVQSLQAEEE